ncbi:CPBP family intramembrane metalloprotease [Pelotomaculum terephthalicicum JT]|uniref:CPBP family intramembrane glutamic endopeptidase n=1 Tax=Pelotomaculum TaxID=191373 RepID=UPI0009CE4099|nr:MULTISPECIES: type II CAAX endopeptidase family protein [Pelotomaculum]MCG9969054.1 CPBP family intramembrane metalloprotease [Pelotomaculum terephthalicicum JT]OPX87361.1 MAG: CAAX amino terminal protease self- immunity [Pelotomaculum sp. PtaB.Bin117]OPY62868.1 MAG: CAAX amino terminal protease self- immunity [Pelotomaculum sp. PtaU1.Bin065]
MSRTQAHLSAWDPEIKSAVSKKDHLFVWLYAIAITAAEVVTTFHDPLYGIVWHVVLLAALLVHASLVNKQAINLVYLALSLAPLIRIMSLATPLVGVPPIYMYLIISLPLFTAAAYVMRYASFKPEDVGLIVGSLPLQLLVASLGVPLGLIEYLILRPAPLAPELTFQHVWLPALILLVSTGFLEEFIFRGVMYRAAAETLGRWYGSIHISFIFAMLHIMHRSPADLVLVFAIALLFSTIVGFFRSLLGVSLAHGLTNIGLYIIWPYLLR